MYLLTYGVGGRRLKIAHMAAPSHGQYLSHWLYAAILNTYKVMKLKVDYAPKKTAKVQHICLMGASCRATAPDHNNSANIIYRFQHNHDQMAFQ